MRGFCPQNHCRGFIYKSLDYSIHVSYKAFSTFFLILELFRTYFLNKLFAPFSNLSWKTEICRPEDLRGDAFNTRLFTWSSGFSLPTQLAKKSICFSSVRQAQYNKVLQKNILLKAAFKNYKEIMTKHILSETFFVPFE